MRKPFFSVVSNKASTVGEIQIYGVIGPSFWDEGVQAAQFVRAFQALEQKYDRIDIHVNGPGGSIWDGLAIFNAIRSSKKETHTFNDGMAFSMSAIVLLAGKTVHVAKGSMSMLHNASGVSAGNAEDMRETADTLDKHDNVLSELIAEKTGQTVDEVKAKWMDYKDHFLTAQEMVDAGLADVLDEYEAKDMPKDAQNMTLDQIAAFYNEQMEEPSESFLQKVFNHVTNLTQNNMKYPKVFALKGIEKPSQEQLDQANAELAESGITAVGLYPESVIDEGVAATANANRLTGELATANQTIVTLNTTITGLQTAATASATKITDLEAKVAAFGKKPGALHSSGEGNDVAPVEGDDMEAIIANMPHNRAADALTGKPKPKA